MQGATGVRGVMTVTTMHCLTRSASTAAPSDLYLAIIFFRHRSFGSVGRRRTPTIAGLGAGPGLDDASAPSWFAPSRARASSVTHAQGSDGLPRYERAGTIFVL